MGVLFSITPMFYSSWVWKNITLKGGNAEEKEEGRAAK